MNKWDTKSILAMFLIVSMVGITFTLMFMPATMDNDVLKILIGGFMTVGFTSVINYYFGSSSSSKDKDDTISSMVIKQPTPELPKPTGGDIKTENTTVKSENTVVESVAPEAHTDATQPVPPLTPAPPRRTM